MRRVFFESRSHFGLANAKDGRMKRRWDPIRTLATCMPHRFGCIFTSISNLLSRVPFCVYRNQPPTLPGG